MLCIHNTQTDPYFNLAAEEYLLKNFKENIFMLWQNEPSIVIGKHQDVWAEVNLKFVQDQQIKIARRFSGGGAVYHDPGNLNLTFIETGQIMQTDKPTIQIRIWIPVNKLSTMENIASAFRYISACLSLGAM